jgi:hypothetical protein
MAVREKKKRFLVTFCRLAKSYPLLGAEAFALTIPQKSARNKTRNKVFYELINVYITHKYIITPATNHQIVLHRNNRPQNHPSQSVRQKYEQKQTPPKRS